MSALLEERPGTGATGERSRSGNALADLGRLQTKPATVAAGLFVVVLLSALIRLEGHSTWLWIDEAISVGIASQPLSDMPALLRQDGSPPLYYFVLHLWMAMVGQSEADLHALSLLFAVATVPVGYWAGHSLFNRRAGWFCALLAATSPYLTAYSREARMYTMVALLALVVVTTFLHSFAFGRRRYLPAFVTSTVLLLYTHNWALFLLLGLAAAAALCAIAAVDRRRVLTDALLSFGAVAVAFGPWVPSLAYQAAHTGAPWASVPSMRTLASAVSNALGGTKELVVLVVMAALIVGTAVLRPHRDRPWLPIVTLLVVVVVALGAAWGASQVKPSWSPRYFGVFVTPMLLVIAAMLSRDGRRGLLALVLILLLWTGSLAWVAGRRIPARPDDKSNVKWLAAQFGPLMQPGDVVASAEIEGVPLLRYYLPPGLRYATPEGMVADPRVVDWRDAFERLKAAPSQANLGPVLDGLGVGMRVFLVCPRYVPPVAAGSGQTDPALVDVVPGQDRANGVREGFSGSWYALVQGHCRSWMEQLSGDSRLRLVAGPTPPPAQERRGAAVFVMAYQRN
ncbi:MAG TPA: glycosyltransferase family 39 protein [Acidimicrobiales bacterium]|nr:glycosyltransferase family 39 protein [Acidimicrobiales bacterium]